MANARSRTRKTATRGKSAGRRTGRAGGAATPGRKRRRRKRSAAETQHLRDAAGLGLIAAGCYLGGIFYFGWAGGALGSSVEQLSLVLVGRAALVFPVIAVVIGLLLIARSGLIDPGPFRAGLYILVPTVLLMFGADRFGIGDGSARAAGFDADRIVEHGGYAGAVLYYTSYELFGNVGTTIICVLGVTLSVLFVTGSSIQAIAGWWARRIGSAAASAGQTSRAFASRVSEATAEPIAATRDALRGGTIGEDRSDAPFDAAEKFPDIFGDIPERFARPLMAKGNDELTGVSAHDTPATGTGRQKGSRRGRKRRPGNDDDQLELIAPGEESDAAVAAPGHTEDPDAVAGDSHRHTVPELLRATVTDGYRLPDASILERSTGGNELKPADVERTKQLLVETFGHFGIQSRVTGMVPGPRVSRYELSLAPGTKMSKVENLRKDLAYALATTEIRILAPIPGKSAVGIEVENAKPSMVTLGDIWQPAPAKSSPLHVWLGKDISGRNMGADLARMPHLLVAGTTGAGKSGCMNAILSSILLGASPDEVRMLLIDPKKVELSTYEGIPHLLTPVVTNMKKAANALGNVVAQMEERYSSMEIAGARTLPEFNKVLEKRGDAPLPYVLVIIDELADLVMTAKSDVEDAVIRVAQKGRAAGFHLVLATQRPSVDVITGMIKSNVPSRIAFAVSSQTDSRVILDQNGAETLLGSGDMLVKPVWARTVQRVQGAWIGEAEVRALCDASREQREPAYDVDLLREPEAEPVADDPGGVDEDERLPEAIRLIAEFQTCSASFFQRRMRVGYTRGARLVDMLERRGLVAPGEGPRPRNVLITADDLPRILEELGTAALAGVEDHD